MDNIKYIIKEGVDTLFSVLNITYLSFFIGINIPIVLITLLGYLTLPFDRIVEWVYDLKNTSVSKWHQSEWLLRSSIIFSSGYVISGIWWWFPLVIDAEYIVIGSALMIIVGYMFTALIADDMDGEGRKSKYYPNRPTKDLRQEWLVRMYQIITLPARVVLNLSNKTLELIDKTKSYKTIIDLDLILRANAFWFISWLGYSLTTGFSSNLLSMSLITMSAICGVLFVMVYIDLHKPDKKSAEEVDTTSENDNW